MYYEPYQIFRAELIEWVEEYTGYKHIDSAINDEAKAGYFTVYSIKGESISKSRETEYYKIVFYNYGRSITPDYTILHNKVCELRTMVLRSVIDNFESSNAGIVDYEYKSYEYDYGAGRLELLFTFDFERQYYID